MTLQWLISFSFLHHRSPRTIGPEAKAVEAMQKMAQGPRQAEWEDFMAVFQKCEPGQRSDEKWQMMERMFHVYP